MTASRAHRRSSNWIDNGLDSVITSLRCLIYMSTRQAPTVASRARHTSTTTTTTSMGQVAKGDLARSIDGLAGLARARHGSTLLLLLRRQRTQRRGRRPRRRASNSGMPARLCRSSASPAPTHSGPLVHRRALQASDDHLRSSLHLRSSTATCHGSVAVAAARASKERAARGAKTTDSLCIARRRLPTQQSRSHQRRPSLECRGRASGT